MNYQNNTGYVGGMPPYGYSYQGNQNPPKFTNPLTSEQIKSLRQNSDKFNLGLTQEEVLRGICFHRDENGNDTLRTNPDGTVTCSICGYTFDPVQDMSEEEAQAAVDGLVDILQTIKLLYLDMPVEPASEFFQIIPLLEKTPKLLKLASDNFSRHEQWSNYRYNGAPSTVNLYNMLSGGMPGAFNINPTPYGAPQQPMGGYMGQQPMGAPYMGAQPQMNQGWNQPNPMMNGGMMNNGSNGFVNYGGQQPMNNGYQPASTGFQYTPNNTGVQQQVAAPQSQSTPGAVTPNSSTATTDGKKVEVNSTFKA